MTSSDRDYIGRRFDTNEPVRVVVKDGKIASCDNLDPRECPDAPIIAPGLFDIQVNGAVGVEFSSTKLTEQGVIDVLEKMLRDGVFRICPTLTTNSPDAMIYAARTIAGSLAKRPDLASVVWGLHLEGPFISTAEGAIGAHPKRYVVPYSRELLTTIQGASNGMVKLVTLSPEHDGAEEFIRELRGEGITVAIGHTNATPLQIDAAARAGAALSTHLSNATRHLLPKWENYFFAQLADDRLMASIIVDGFHISPQLVRAIVRTKGLDRLILISDQSPLAGFPPGKYSMELCDFEIQPNGKVTLAGDPNLLACASFPVTNCLVNLACIEDLTLGQVFPLATSNPARLLGAPEFSNGSGDFLAPGASADFILFRVERATFGDAGVLDGASFRTGRLRFEAIVRNGARVNIEA